MTSYGKESQAIFYKKTKRRYHMFSYPVFFTVYLRTIRNLSNESKRFLVRLLHISPIPDAYLSDFQLYMYCDISWLAFYKNTIV